MKIIDTEQGTDEWKAERLGCVTGTRIESAVGAKWSKAKERWVLGYKDKQFTLLCEIVSELQSDNVFNDLTTAAMARGHELEPLSVEAASKKRGINFQVCGMLQCDWNSRFKFSPDAVYIDNKKIKGGYETKSKQGKTHIEYSLKNEIPKEHFWQCIGPMIMDDDVEWWDFGHYDDRNFVNKLFIKRLHRHEVSELIIEARKYIKRFFRDVELARKQLKQQYEDII